MDFGIASVAAIVVICYLVGIGVKCIPGVKNDLIPFIVGIVGLVLGIVAMIIGVPDFPATDYLTAAAVGVVSGLSATGINQAAKSISNKSAA